MPAGADPRDELHKLVDHVPEAAVAARPERFLRSWMDPVALSLLNAPPDDEAETAEKREAVESGKLVIGVQMLPGNLFARDAQDLPEAIIVQNEVVGVWNISLKSDRVV